AQGRADSGSGSRGRTFLEKCALIMNIVQDCRPPSSSQTPFASPKKLGGVRKSSLQSRSIQNCFPHFRNSGNVEVHWIGLQMVSVWIARPGPDRNPGPTGKDVFGAELSECSRAEEIFNLETIGTIGTAGTIGT